MKRVKSRTLSNPIFLLFLVALAAIPLLLGGLLSLTDPALAVADRGYFLGLIFLTYLVAFALTLPFAWQRARVFIERTYGLEREEAGQLLHLLVFGVPTLPPPGPAILVSEGVIDPDGPETLRKVGGPGFVAIRPDSAVVTSRGGYLHRVLGPGFHELEPFERIWDAVDLRRQRRKVSVEAITRDGIPVSTEVEVFFKVAGGEASADELRHYPFDPQSILRLTTMKRALADGQVKRWPSLVVGKVVGAVRNKLESMRLEEILNMHSNGDAPLAALSREIESLVRPDIDAWGVEIEAVRVGSVQPVDETVSERWVQHWRAKWERAIRHWSAQAKTSGWQAVEQARIQAELDLLLRTIEGWGELLEGDLGNESQEVLAQLLQMRFMDVLRSMAKEDPLVQMTVLEQAETLQEMLTASSRSALPGGMHRSDEDEPALPADGT